MNVENFICLLRRIREKMHLSTIFWDNPRTARLNSFERLQYPKVVSCLLVYSVTITLLPKTEFVQFLPMLGNSVHAHGLGQLTRDFRNNVRTLNFRSDVAFAPPQKASNDVRKRSLCDIICPKRQK